MKTVTLRIEKKEYDINLQDDIAEKMEAEIRSDFRHPDDISLKELLAAYVKTRIDKHELQKEIDTVHDKLNSLEL